MIFPQILTFPSPGQLPSNCPLALKLPRKHPFKNQVWFSHCFWRILMFFIFFLFLTFSIPLYKTFWCMWWRIIIRRRRNFWNWCSAALKMFHRLTFLTNPEVQACCRKKFETKENQVLILQTTQDHKKMGEKKEKINVFDVDAVQFVMFWRMQWLCFNLWFHFTSVTC